MDIDHAGNDHGLAVDDLSVTAHGDPRRILRRRSPLTAPGERRERALPSIRQSPSISVKASARPQARLRCSVRLGTSLAFVQSASPASSVTLTPSADLPYGTICTVTVVANQVTDTDTDDPNDQMASNFVFSFTTADPPVDAAPAVSSTTPANGATNVAAGSNIVINFSESVAAGAPAFSLNCGGVPKLRTRRLTGQAHSRSILISTCRMRRAARSRSQPIWFRTPTAPIRRITLRPTTCSRSPSRTRRHRSRPTW